MSWSVVARWPVPNVYDCNQATRGTLPRVWPVDKRVAHRTRVDKGSPVLGAEESKYVGPAVHSLKVSLFCT